MLDDLESAARKLTLVVNGIDWDPVKVQHCVDVVLHHGKGAPVEELDSAVAILLERLQHSKVDDADGVAQLAITGGTLVELGASPGALAALLVEKVPSILRAARRYADRCLADSRSPSEYPEDEELDAITEVDQRPILREVFSHYLKEDRPGGVALAYLKEWVLPAVATWTRHRHSLERAVHDSALVDLSARMAQSDANWLKVLLGVQLHAPWLVLCPLQSRGFRLLVDGIVSNFDLHALVAAALVARGIEGTAPPDEVIAFLEGHGDKPQVNHVEGTWNLYDYRASTFDLRDGDKIPHEYWVWGEGIPNDVPKAHGVRTLLVGPASYKRSWSLGRVFSRLPSSLTVTEELDKHTYDSELSRLIDACGGS